MTNRRFNLTPAEYVADSGKLVRQFADGGAVDQDGTKPMFRCDCGQNVVWVKSARTGRNYLAHAMRYTNSDRHFYVKAQPHTWDRHDEIVARRDGERARLAQKDADRNEARMGLVALYTTGTITREHAARLLGDAHAHLLDAVSNDPEYSARIAAFEAHAGVVA